MLLCITLITVCCSKSNNQDVCNATTNAPIKSVLITANNTVNNPINIFIKYKLFSSCGAYNGIIKNVIADTTTLYVGAAYTGCTCTILDSTELTTYTFTPTKAGTYYYKFWQSDTLSLKDSIIVK